ncbi:MAG: lysylphosphatidylglycerol synthase transmembrane domain-containing protein [Rectinemataceae bacterium]
MSSSTGSVPTEWTPSPGENPPKKKKTILRKVLLALIAGLAINVALGSTTDLKELAGLLSKVGPTYVLIPFLAIVAVFFVDSLRYKIVFKPFGVHLSFRDAFYNNVIGYFLCGITPSSAGGQPFQIMHFSRLGLDSAVSTNIVFSRLMETNIVQLIVVSVFAKRGVVLMNEAGKGAYILTAGIVATAVVAILLVLAMLYPHLIGKLGKKIDGSKIGQMIGRISKEPLWAEKLSAWTLDLREGFRFMWGKNTGVMLTDILLTAADQVLWALGLYAPLVATTGTTLPFGDFLFVFVLCNMISGFVPTPGAAGGMEATFTLVLGAITGDHAGTVSSILLWRFGSYYLHLALGALAYALVPVAEGSYSRRPDGRIRRLGRRDRVTLR